MSRKEKVEKAQKRRQQQTVVNPALADAVQKDITEKGSVDASTAPVAAIKNDAELANSREISRLGGVNAEKLGYTVSDGVLKNPLEVQNKGLEQAAQKGATATKQSSINVPQVQATGEETKAPTLLDLTAQRLAEMKEKAETEKTDAAKMQKYYALTDALSALGKIGGTAIGGALGGNALDSAPIVGEYKPSRGYLDAIEKSKQANERLKALDEKEFQLAVRYEDRSYKQQMDKLNRDYQKWMTDYKSRLDRAKAEENFAMQQELMEEKAQIEQGLKEKTLALQNKYNLAEKDASRATMRLQHELYNTVPVAFNNGTGIRVSKSDYEGMKSFFIGKTLGGRTINKDNFDAFVRENPKLVGDSIGLFSEQTESPKTKPSSASSGTGSEAQKPNSVSQTGFLNPVEGIDWYNKFLANSPRNQVETEVNLEEIKKGIADYKE